MSNLASSVLPCAHRTMTSVKIIVWIMQRVRTSVLAFWSSACTTARARPDAQLDAPIVNRRFAIQSNVVSQTQIQIISSVRNETNKDKLIHTNIYNYSQHCRFDLSIGKLWTNLHWLFNHLFAAWFLLLWRVWACLQWASDNMSMSIGLPRWMSLSWFLPRDWGFSCEHLLRLECTAHH